jgi:hypothetical protein
VRLSLSGSENNVDNEPPPKRCTRDDVKEMLQQLTVLMAKQEFSAVEQKLPEVFIVL